MRVSKGYRLTLPVINGEIQDTNEDLARLRREVRQFNARRNRGVTRYRRVIDLKWRGPRMGRPYTTPRDVAYAVDVYDRQRREWN